MTGYHAASEYTKTVIVALLCTGIFLVIAYGAPFWTTRPDGHAGLWWGCTGSQCYERWDFWTSSWIKGSQAFMTLALITWFFATVSIIFYIFHRSYDEDRRLVFLSFLLTLGTGVFSLLGVFIWAANEHFGSGEVLNWPYAFACLVCVLSFVTAFLLKRELNADNATKNAGYSSLQDANEHFYKNPKPQSANNPLDIHSSLASLGSPYS